MSPALRFLVLLGAIVAGAACAQAAGGGTFAQEEGRALFQRHCVECHGQGGDRIPASPLSSRDFLDSRGDATLASSIADGKGVMPAWSRAREGPLTDAQVWSVVAYLDDAAGRSGPSALAPAGRAIYAERCVRCHGEKGDRIPVAPLTQQAFLASRTDVELVSAVTDGVGMMPASRESGDALTTDQARAVVAYLRFNVESALAERIRRGRDLYLAGCLACHGEKGDRVAAVPLASASRLRRAGDGAIVTVIADGRAAMPAFGAAKGGPLAVEDVGALVAYLKSWSGLPAGLALAADVGPVTTGDARGRELFTRTCAACHGDRGDRVSAARLNDPTWLRQRGDVVLAQSVASGKGVMMAFGTERGGPLTPEDIAAVLSYTKSLAGFTTGVAAALGPADAGLVRRGGDVFAARCASCHGDTPARLGRLADASWLQQRGDAALLQSVADGRSVPGSKDAMPPFAAERGGPLSAEDIRAVVAFLKDAVGLPLAAPSPSPRASLDPAAVARGARLYAESCVICHGQRGDRVASARLADASYLGGRGDDALSRSIAMGKGAMGAFGKDRGGPLDAPDIAALLAYLKSLAGGGS